MRAEIEIGSNLNSGVNGVLLRNCSIASGETNSGQNYIQNFRKNRKLEYAELEGYKILAAFKSRRENVLFFLTERKTDDGKFQVWVKPGIDGIPYCLTEGKEELEKKDHRLSFSYDYGKLNEFTDFDCILVCAYGVLLAFNEENENKMLIETDSKLPGKISGICAFANRMIATSHGKDEYMWNGLLKPHFEMTDEEGMPTGAGTAASEYGNDLTQAVRRTGSRLAVFTNKTIEIKDVSNDPDLPFQGYLYQNNYDVGAIAPTILSLNGTLYFVGEDMSGLRSIYSLADGALKKLTNETQSLLFDGIFASAGTMQEGSRTFYCAYGSRSFGMDILNGSLFEIDGEMVLSDGGYGGANPPPVTPPPPPPPQPPVEELDYLIGQKGEFLLSQDGKNLIRQSGEGIAVLILIGQKYEELLSQNGSALVPQNTSTIGDSHGYT